MNKISLEAFLLWVLFLYLILSTLLEMLGCSNVTQYLRL